MLTWVLLMAPALIPCEAPPSGMACVPGGDFLRGTSRGQKAARPQETVWLQTTYMDLNEVTNAEYDACEAAGKCNAAGPIYADFSRPQQPINGLSWFDAVKYCEAMGKHLPTEAEWEKAARGVDGRRYPWGNEKATCKRAVIKDKRGRSCGVKKRGKGPDKGRVFVVGKKPPAIHGLYDMAGNSYEWVYDWMSPSYAECGAACQGEDPKGPCGGASPCKGHRQRVVRGGSWYWGADRATTFWRRAYRPNNTPPHHFGFRCAASPDQAKALTATP
jgi:formylglycine-generating enzyme